METMIERALPGVGSPLRVFPTTNAERMYALDEGLERSGLGHLRRLPRP